MGRAADELARLDREIAELSATIARSLGGATAALDAAQADRAAATRRALAAARSALAEGGCEAYDAWSSPRWASWSPRPDVPSELRIGWISTDVDELPATVPVVSGDAVVLATRGAAAGERAREVLRGLAVRAAGAMGRGVVLHLIDPFQEGFGFPERGSLGNAAPTGKDAASDLEAAVTAAKSGDASGVRHLVLAMDYPRRYSYQAVELVNRLARLAPAGVQVVVHHDLDADTPGSHDDLDLTNPCVVTIAFDGTAAGPWGGFRAHLDGPAPTQLLERLAPHLAAPRTDPDEAPILPWDAVNDADPGRWWRGDASDAIRAVVGRTVDGQPLEVVLGQEVDGNSMAHMVLAGETGIGKSVLLRTLITSLATRYSPHDLRFYLIDGQNGAGFGDYRTLPHADLVSLNAPVDLMRAFLIDVDSELTRRSGLLSARNASDIGQYRRDVEGGMPRLVIVIDEYQRLFQGDARDETAGVLRRIAAQGRKVGIHLVLCSQRFRVSGMIDQDTLFANLAIRAAMKMPVDTLDGVDEFGPEGRTLIRNHCVRRGAVVLNDAGGRAGHNVAGLVALQAYEEHAARVEDLRRRAQGPDPVLVDGTQQPDPGDNRTLAALAQVDPRDWEAVSAWAQSHPRDGGLRAPSWHSFDAPLPFIVGRSLSVYGSAFATLERKPDQNVLLVADNPEVLTGMMQASVASIALAVPELRVTTLAQLPGQGPWRDALTANLAEALANRGHTVRTPTDADPEALLAEAVAELDRRLALDADAQLAAPPHLVVAAGLDRLAAFRLVEGAYELVASQATASLLRLAKEGPEVGIHVVLGFTGATGYERVMPARSTRRFAHRFVRQLSEKDSLALLDGTFGTRVNAAKGDGETLGPDRAGYVNAVSTEQTIFLPYLAGERLTAVLRDLLGRRRP